MSLAIAVAALLALLAVIAYFAVKGVPKGVEAPQEEEEEQQPVRDEAEPVRRVPARAGMRRRGVRGAAAAAVAAVEEVGEDGEEGGAGESAPAASARESYEARRAARDAAREAEEAAQEAEIARVAEERRLREEEEAERWKSLFEVQAQGEEAGSGAEKQKEEDERLVAFFRARKIAPLDEAAAELGIRGAKVAERVTTLLADGTLSGIVDERGKFVHVSQDEMRAVADYVKSRGRVTIAELAAKSAELIDLSPAGDAEPGAQEDVEKLLAEE